MSRAGLAVLGLAGCFGPHAPLGAMCAANGECPAGLECAQATNTCELSSVDAQRPDATPDAIDQACIGPAGWALCLPALPSDAIMLGGSLNTDDSSQCLAEQPASWSDAGQPAACIIIAGTIAVPTDLAVTGSRPLVIAAASTVSILGTIDVASHRDVARGPGASSAACGGYVRTPQDNSSGAGGGAGASFMTKGGDGGSGRHGAAVAGIAPVPESLPALLRGGCRGQDGGRGGLSGGRGGEGGGALYIVAGSQIALGAATVNASGAGGSGSGARAGGGGGGSGGMIVLHAPEIAAFSARLVANGGGGGEGADSESSANDGSDPDPTAPDSPASGGGKQGERRGGDGYAGGLASGNGGDQNDNGGGGGGGGGGFVGSNRELDAAQVSPPRTSF